MLVTVTAATLALVSVGRLDDTVPARSAPAVPAFCMDGPQAIPLLQVLPVDRASRRAFRMQERTQRELEHAQARMCAALDRTS